MTRRRLAAGTGRLRERLVPETELGEPRIWPAAAIVSAALLYATLPGRFVAGPSAGVFSAVRWIVPGLTLLLLAALLASAPEGRLMRIVDLPARHLHVGRRVASLATIGVLSAANSASIYLLVHDLVNGGHVVAAPLLRAAVHMWCVNVLVFALWFWQLDGGGPLARRTTVLEVRDRDFLFPQQASPDVFPPGWNPTFVDYLFVSFTNAAAFSPTDTLPLSRWAKVLMLIQSSISLSLAVMVVARAVNILR